MDKLKRGDKVKLKGRTPIGIIKTMGSDNHWICVQWLGTNKGPKYVHEFELEKLLDVHTIY